MWRFFDFWTRPHDDGIWLLYFFGNTLPRNPSLLISPAGHNHQINKRRPIIMMLRSFLCFAASHWRRQDRTHLLQRERNNGLDKKNREGDQQLKVNGCWLYFERNIIRRSKESLQSAQALRIFLKDSGFYVFDSESVSVWKITTCEIILVHLELIYPIESQSTEFNTFILTGIKTGFLVKWRIML